MPKSEPRVRDGSTPWVTGQIERSTSNDATWYPFGTKHDISREVLYMSDKVVKNYHQRVARGEIFNNPVYRKEETNTSGGGTCEFKRLSDNYRIYQRGPGSVTKRALIDRNDDFLYLLQPVGANAETKENAEARARLEAISRIDSTPYEFMEDAFEIRETLRFIRRPLGSLADLGKGFHALVKNRSKGDVYRTWDAVNSAWLQYRFAASPLVRSVMDGFEAYDKRHSIKRPARRTARGAELLTNDAYDSVAPTVSGIKRYYKRTGKYERRIRAGILYTVHNPVNDINFKLGMRVKDVPKTLWAVMPYSFMVDRVVDVTSAIEGVQNLISPYVNILAAWESYIAEYSNDVQFYRQTQSGWQNTIDGDHVIIQGKVYSRQPWLPSISDTVPKLTFQRLVADATSTMDLIALVKQRFFIR